MKRLKTFKPALVCFGIMTILCGVIYTLAVTAMAQVLFPSQANGSMITVTLQDGTQKEYGSELLAHAFTNPKYLIGRPMGTTNLSPVGDEQEKRVQERIRWLHSIDPDNTQDIPADLVMASGSGVDPHISPQAAEYQVPRIARERYMAENEIRNIIKKYTTGRFLGWWGEAAVNVLKVNLVLDGLK